MTSTGTVIAGEVYSATFTLPAGPSHADTTDDNGDTVVWAFAGWDVVWPGGASLGVYQAGETVTLANSDDITFLAAATWTTVTYRDVTITLAFSANGGSPEPSTMTSTGTVIAGEVYSATFTLPAGPTHADTTEGAYIITWTFAGWDVVFIGGANLGVYQAGETVTLTNNYDITFLAAATWTTVATYYPGWSWSVNGSTVFLDTYGVVLVDPSIDIQAYFPDDDVQRLNFYSFAIYGDSLTVNGQTFQVVNGVVQDVPVRVTQGMDADGVEYQDLTLQNIAVSWSDDGHCYLTFINEGGDRTDEYPAGATADLGAIATREDGTPDKTVSFAGVWYMTCAYYRGTTAYETHYSWDAGKWGLTASEFMCIWLLAMLAIGVVAHHYRTFKTLDFVVLAGALLVGWAIIGYIF